MVVHAVTLEAVAVAEVGEAVADMEEEAVAEIETVAIVIAVEITKPQFTI